MKTSAILLAGGHGSRIQSEKPKQFMPLCNKPIVHYSLELFLSLEEIFEVIIVVDPAYHFLFETFSNSKSIKFALPGKRRQDSVYSGLKQVDQETSFVCIHDAARPFIQKKDLQNLLQAGYTHKAAALATPLKFTVKHASTEGVVINTPPRDTLFEIQTPQILQKKLLEDGFKYILERDITVTDDLSIAELLNHSTIKLVPGNYSNIKITTNEDLFLAPYLLQHVQL